MHKRALLACLLVVAMLLSSCALVKKDLAVDAATPILTVGDKVFTKSEVQSAVNNYLAQMQSYYTQYYGHSIDVTDAAVVADAQNTVIDTLTRQTVVENKAKELGLDQLSEEAQAEVDDLWNSYYDIVKSSLYSESELSEEELDAAVSADVANYFGITKESLAASKVQELVRAEAVKDVTVTDEQIQTEFDSRVEEAKTNYASNLSAYGSSFNNGSVVYYRPAGYRLVKQILTKFTDNDQALMDDLNSKITELNSTISSLQTALTDAGVEDVDALLSQVNVTLTETVVEPAEETEVPEVKEAAAEAAAEAEETAAETVEAAAETAEAAAETTEAGTETVAETVEAAIENAAETAEAAIENAAETAESAVETVTEAAESAVETVAETSEAAVEAVTETAETAVTKAPEFAAATEDTLAADLDETVKTNVRDLKIAQEKLASYTTMLDEAKAKAYANIDARADEILSELANGADWDTLMAEKTEDPGMQSGRATAETGYAVCENMSGFDSAFVEAAMALEKVGDTSGKIASDLYGYYIIQYSGDVEEGPVALEGTVKDTIQSDLQTTYEDEAYEAAVDSWVAATKVTSDLKALNN